MTLLFLRYRGSKKGKRPCVTLWAFFVNCFCQRTLCYNVGSICKIWVWGPCVTSWAAFVNDSGQTTLCYTCIMGCFFETQFALKDPVAQLFIVSVHGLHPWGSPNAWWDGSMCSHFPTHVSTAVRVSAMLPAFLAAALQSVDFSNGACHVMKTTIAESSPDMELFTQQTFRFIPDIRCQ